MRLSDVLQDRLDTANKSRDHVMAMAIQKQKRIEELTELLTAATNDAKEAEAYAEELEAKLTKAVEALRKIADYTHIGDKGVTQNAEARIARAVLAELEKTE
jgi:hypothetical protein